MKKKQLRKLKGTDLKLAILSRIESMTARQVCMSLGLKETTLSYHLRQLKVLDVITKIGYGVWKVHQKNTYKIHHTKPHVKKRLKQLRKTKSCRSRKTGGVGKPKFVVVRTGKDGEDAGHGFMWVLKLPVMARWNQTGRRKYLVSRKIEHTPIHQGERLESRLTLGWKVHLTNKSIVGYAPKGQRWYGGSAEDSAGECFFEFLRIVQRLENVLNVSFLINGVYNIKPRREHHALVGNILPCITKEREEKFAVWDDNGVWLLIDESGELELETTGTGERAGKPIRQATELVRTDYNQLKDEGVTRQVLMDMIAGNARDIQGNTKHVGHFGEHMRTHVKVMNSIDGTLKRLNTWLDKKRSR